MQSHCIAKHIFALKTCTKTLKNLAKLWNKQKFTSFIVYHRDSIESLSPNEKSLNSMQHAIKEKWFFKLKFHWNNSEISLKFTMNLETLIEISTPLTFCHSSTITHGYHHPWPPFLLCPAINQNWNAYPNQTME